MSAAGCCPSKLWQDLVPFKYGGTKILTSTYDLQQSTPWNKGQLAGQKRPLKLQEVLGDKNPTANSEKRKRVGAIQFSYR